MDIDTYVSKLQTTHIAPFLSGYTIETKKIAFTGRYASEGIGSYLVEYVCKKGEDKKVSFGFYTTVLTYDSGKVSDEIHFDYIQLEELKESFITYWDTVAIYNGVSGLSGYLN